MNSKILVQILCCLTVFTFYLYHIIQKQNQINYLSLNLPKIVKELKTLEEENMRLRFQVNSFQSPDHLMQLVKEEQYTHLKMPLLKEVFTFQEGLALNQDQDIYKDQSLPREPVLAVGVYH